MEKWNKVTQYVMGCVDKEKFNINKMKLMLLTTVGGLIGNLVDLFLVPLNNQKLL